MDLSEVAKSILMNEQKERAIRLLKEGKPMRVDINRARDEEDKEIFGELHGLVVKTCVCDECTDNITIAAEDKDGDIGVGSIPSYLLVEPYECNQMEDANSVVKASDTMNISKAPSPAAYILQVAQEALQERADSRDTPEGERAMPQAVAAFNALYGTSITEEQGSMFMVMLKAARSTNGKYKEDDYVDGAAYFALAGEAASKQ